MRTVILFALAMFPAACATTPYDELAEESDTDTSAGKADDTAKSGFYSARRVVARCLEPECRGIALDRVNRAATICLDGASAPSCWVPDPQIDWTRTGLTAEQIEGLVTELPYGLGPGTEAPVLLHGQVSGGRFVVTEAWLAGRPAAPVDDVVVRVRIDKAACGSPPCQTLVESKLNSTLRATLGDLDFESEYGNDVATFLTTILYDEESPGILIAGERTRLADGSKSRSVTNYWLKIVTD